VDLTITSTIFSKKAEFADTLRTLLDSLGIRLG
jgi:hypothetical protein